MCVGRVRHTFEKLLRRATNLRQISSQSEVGARSYERPKSGSPNWDSFGTPLWESREKVPFGCKCGGEAQRILYGGRWWLPLSPGRGESNEFKVARGLS